MISAAPCGAADFLRKGNIKMGNLTVKFAKPYKFEGTEYDEVDLSGMDGMTIRI